MKPIKVLLSLIFVVAVLFASTLSVYAIGFNAEEVYDSVFVIYSGNSLGSGFAVGKNCIVTNAHVVSSKRNIYVQSYAGDEYQATIIGLDESKDIAVLAIEGVNFAYLPIADISTTKIGDDVYAIGAPKSMAYTLTKGVISAKERIVGRNSYIQIDAAINEGNSGGPLLNDSGQVLGMNTLKMSDSEGIGLAIPANVICEYLNELGIELDSSGNVVNEVSLPTEDTTEPTQSNSDDKTQNDKPSSESESISVITYVAFAIAGVSLIGNMVLFILLIYQKKKNLNLKYDPKERTDFDIDVWE